MAEQFKGFQITCAFYLFDFAGWELGIDEVHQRHVALEGFQHPAAGLLVEGIFGQFVECRFVSAFIDDDRAVVNAAHHSGDASPFVQQLLGAAVTNSAYTFDVVGGIPLQSFGFEESTRSRQADQLWELLKVHLLVFGVFTKAHPADFFSNQLQPVAVAGEQVDMIDRWLWRKTTNQHPRQSSASASLAISWLTPRAAIIFRM